MSNIRKEMMLPCVRVVSYGKQFSIGGAHTGSSVPRMPKAEAHGCSMEKSPPAIATVTGKPKPYTLVCVRVTRSPVSVLLRDQLSSYATTLLPS
jgi:hypothetical protein